MNSFNVENWKKNQNYILPSFHFFEQILNDNLNSDEYISQENKETLSENNLYKKKGFSKENTIPNNKELLIGQFKNQMDLENNISEETKNIQKEKEIKIKNNKKKFGRKRKRNNEDIQSQDKEESERNKFSDDNLRRKCKHLVLKYAQNFINNKIKIIYNGNIGNGILRKELQTINHFQKYNINIDFNKEFLTKTFKDIFSDNISTRFANFPLNHNKTIINYLLNEKDEKKRTYFHKLFNINFIQCLNHFIGKDFICELNGLKLFEEIKKEEILAKYPLDGEEYYNNLFKYLNNYEEIINSKKPRRFRKKMNK